jgi:uncharacterized protein (TIGR04255 family)
VFELDPAPNYHLASPPLALAVAQVKYPLRSRFSRIEGIASIQDELEDTFPDMNAVPMQELTLPMPLSVDAIASVQIKSETVVNWRFTDNLGHAFVVAVDSATLEVGSAYQGINDFAERFYKGLQALETVGGVRRCTRLGLRYLNIAETRPDEEHAWREWFRPELVGWVGGNVMSADTRLAASITQTQLRARATGDFAVFPAEVQAIIRHGWFPPGTGVPGLPPRPITQPAYLLDIDLFIEYLQDFTADSLIEQLRVLHSQIDRFFYWSLTENGARHFGLEVRDAADRSAQA